MTRPKGKRSSRKGKKPAPKDRAATEAFGKRVTEARLNLAAARKAEVTRVAIGQALGVSGATVGRWEKGQKEPGLARIIRLAEYLEIDPGELAFGAIATQPATVHAPRPPLEEKEELAPRPTALPARRRKGA